MCIDVQIFNHKIIDILIFRGLSSQKWTTSGINHRGYRRDVDRDGRRSECEHIKFLKHSHEVEQVIWRSHPVYFVVRARQRAAAGNAPLAVLCYYRDWRNSIHLYTEKGYRG
jgi:alpha-galactosidase/6-phospho-beta-glucosidase family protein